MSSITIREFNDEDLSQTLDLLKNSLGESPVLRRTPELFAWKHLNNPFGRSLLLVAESGQRIVGLRAFMRWTLTCSDGSELKCVRAVDTATHPDFQRQGIFRRLTLTGIDAARDSGADLVFNTPNRKSGPGYLKMGWGEVGKVGIFVFPRLGGLRRNVETERPDGPYLESTHDLLEEDSWQSDRQPMGLRTSRSGDYLGWRFKEHPTATYSIVQDSDSSIVLRSNVRRGRRELVVSELLGSVKRSNLFGSVLASTSQYAVGWFSKGSPERRILLGSGFVPVPWVSALRLVALPLHNDLPVDVFDQRSWDLSLGDLELL